MLGNEPRTAKEGMMANHKRYGPGNGKGRLSLADYHQSKDNLRDLPQTQVEKIPVTNTPNIFSYKSYVFSKKPELIQRYIKATKADVGGVGGHVVAAEEVKSAVAEFVLENDSFLGGRPRGGGRGGQARGGRVRPREQLVPGAADLHLARGYPHRRLCGGDRDHF